MTIETTLSKKSIQILAAMLFFGQSIFAQSDSLFTIKGKINGLVTDKWVWLQNADENQNIIDSIQTHSGEFSFTGKVTRPSLYQLKIGKSSKESFPFFVENSEINLNCEYVYPFGCEVKGSYNQHLIDEFAIREKIAWNPEVIENLKNTYVNFNEKAGYIRKQKFSEAIKSFGLLHTNDKAVAYLVSLNSSYILDEDLEIIYQNFGDNLKSSIFANEIKAELELRNATKIGRKLVDIKQNDLNGEKVSLWDFREKYVLLYFWASGFEPCRKENAKLKKIYDKYKDWGEFEVMAVSMDSVESEWNRAVIEDNLNWQNVSDLKGWDNSIAQKLNVQAIPYTILLDREGAIIGKDLRAEEIDNILNLIKSTRITMQATNKKKEKKKTKFKSPFSRKSKSGALPGANN
ncbi:MAG: TlpA disulfide reductase family protein [Bacteroidota bacterium]